MATFPEPANKDAYLRAVELKYPRPDSPHGSVMQRWVEDRLAFRAGWDAAHVELAADAGRWRWFRWQWINAGALNQWVPRFGQKSGDGSVMWRGAYAESEVDASADSSMVGYIHADR